MKISKIEIRYAQALFDLATELAVVDKVHDDMKLVDKTCRESRDLRRMLDSPVIRKEKKVQILKELFEKRIQKLSLDFLILVGRKGRESYIPHIAFNFTELYKESRGILTVELITPAPVDGALRKAILAKLTEETGKTIELIEKTDASLIGGFILRHKDKQYDASYHTALERLRKEFDINLYVKEI